MDLRIEQVRRPSAERRRWFSLRSLFWATLLTAMLCGLLSTEDGRVLVIVVVIVALPVILALAIVVVVIAFERLAPICKGCLTIVAGTTIVGTMALGALAWLAGFFDLPLPG